MRRKLRKMNYLSWVGWISSGLLGLLIMVMVGTPMITHAEAAEIQPFSADINTKTSAYVRSSIAVSMSDQAMIDLTPKSTGEFKESSEVQLSVTANNTTGYAIYLTTGDNSSSLLQRNALDEPAKIGAVNGELTAENFRDHLNSWGFDLRRDDETAEGKYIALPKNGDAPVVQTGETANKDDYVLRFGAAVATDLPSGVYSNTVVASVVANPIEVRAITDILTMQEMTSDICKVSMENETARLTDTRDGKSYWVAKLKDGRCWMTQDLGLKITEEMINNGEINPNNSDVSRAWVSDPGEGWSKEQIVASERPYWAYRNSSLTGDNMYYPPTATEEMEVDIKSELEQNTTFSWDMGEWVWATPLVTYEKAGHETITGEKDGLRIREDGEVSGFVNVSDSSKWKATWQAQNGELLGKEVYTAINCKVWDGTTCTEGEYDAHYLVGNYYHFNTATAGTGSTYYINAEAPSSICPKGWRLPTIGDESNISKSGSFYTLLDKYGVTSTAGGETAKDVNALGYNLTLEPLYFVRGGYFDTRFDATWYKENEIIYWSSTMSSSPKTARMLHGRGNSVFMASDSSDSSGVRCIGRPVRCVNAE